MKIEPSIVSVLAESRVENDKLYLMGQLNRPTYLLVNKILESIGGEWNKKLKCHLFKTNIEDILLEIINTGEYDPGIDKKKVLNFFPTPSILAARLVELAEVKQGDKVLEPSAGKGAILQEIFAKKADCSFVEIDKENFDHTQKQFKTFTGYNQDFLSLPINGLFDKIVMNPPFNTKNKEGEIKRDIDHIHSAFNHLAPGGILVSICSEGVFFRNSSCFKNFRDWLADKKAKVFELDSKAFQESGTLVKTRILKIQK